MAGLITGRYFVSTSCMLEVKHIHESFLILKVSYNKEIYK